MFSRGPGRTLLSHSAQHAVKRAIDIAVALTALLLLIPLLLTIAILIVIDSKGPVFYHAERVGFRGRRLRMLKFRKMRVKASGPALTTRGDARLTRVGRVLVRGRLDELPQLWHVLRGQMSLVGPRPEDPRFVARHARDYRDILRVRPGLTGLSQIAFADEASVLRLDDPVGHYLEAILPQKVALDRLYAANPTLGSDVRILSWTFLTMALGARVAVNRSTGAMTLRRRPPPGAEVVIAAEAGPGGGPEPTNAPAASGAVQSGVVSAPEP